MSPAPLPGPPAGGGARTSCSDPPLGEQLLSPQCAWPWGHLWAQLSNSRKRRLPCRWARGWASLGLEGRLTRASTSCLLSSLVSLYPSLWLLGAAAGTSPGSSLQGASEKSPSHGGGCREPLSSSPVYRERQSLARAWGMSFPLALMAHCGPWDRVLLPQPCCWALSIPLLSCPTS